MKRILIFMMLASLSACNNSGKEPAEEPNIEADTAAATTSATVNTGESDLYVWKSSPDYTKEKNPGLRKEIIQEDSLIRGLNRMHENVLLEKVKRSGDTLYTEIKDSEYLSEQMGTTGAEMYLADVILNLTEVPGINYVNIQLKEGSHMQPGTWNKQSFAKYKPVN